MHQTDGRSRSTVIQRKGENQKRVDYALLAIQELASEAIRSGQSGTIGIEIPVKDGNLGKVKRLQVVFQPE